MEERKLFRDFQYAMQHTKILVPVRQTLFTFASTNIRYFLITNLLHKARVEMRKGRITVERPQIITPTVMFEQIFDGFESDQRKYLETLLQTGGLKSLHYKYKNETESVELLSDKLEHLAERLKQEAMDRPLLRTAVIQGVPEMWSLSLMKCTMDLTVQSFSSNIKDLEEHGHFQ